VVYKQKKYQEPKPNQVVGTVAELFAGVGGFRIGLSRSGWQTIYSNQWEPSTKIQHASDCYVFNFGDEGHSNQDISTVQSIPKTDLIVGGFPCQDYSVAKSLNASKGLQGKKGVLWWDIHRLVEKNRPKFVFLENVDRLLKSPSQQRGRDFAIMLSTLGSLGYTVEWRVVNAAEYGFPQRRIRVFIVATKTKVRSSMTMDEASEITYEKGILARSLPIANSSFGMTRVDLKDEPEILSANFGIGGQKSPFLNAGVYRHGVAFTAKVEAIGPSKKWTLADVLLDESQVPQEYFVAKSKLDEWQYLKGAKSVLRTHKGSGATYNYAEGKMAFPDLLTNPSRTILTGEGGASPSRFKHVIEVDKKFRRLTPVELERLNGFPDNWTLMARSGPISDAKRAFFMGNALVVGLIEKVGRVIADDLLSQKDS
jgi:DNA (cytosine-5)-methyltransferase 1